MTGLALTLILTSAFIHATWNLLAKRVGGGVPFTWLFFGLTAAIYTPLAAAVMIRQQPRLSGFELLFVGGSASMHVVYFLALQRGYRVGDLSLVYPLARGTGPLLATTAAVLFLGEHPSPLALAGAGLVGIGVFALTADRLVLRGPKVRGATGYGLLTGTIIATYTLWDKHAVSALLIPPLLYDYGSNVIRTVLLTPFVLRRWDEVRLEWRSHRLEALGVACLSPLSYILVLTAMVFTPVSHVAPAREISILIGTFMGARLLEEGSAGRRIVAASAMMLGVVALG
ncbi:MAG: DMT family transporter [Ardenticatenaceae bacterium]|nr:DMT family transporter [Ardenticatenaceae bacterium]